MSQLPQLCGQADTIGFDCHSDHQRTLAALLDMGFPEAASRQAAATHDSIEAGIEWLMRHEGQTAVTTREGLAPLGAVGAARSGGEPDVGECSICTEELLLADAAMRCAGHGGKKHYFHAHCLTAWVRQCRSAGTGPTCPECRGPVQVRPRRLEEFLQDNGSKLDAEDQHAFQTFHDAATTDVDEYGWSDVKRDLWTAGAVVAVGAGIAVAIAAGVHAFSIARGRSSRDERR